MRICLGIYAHDISTSFRLYDAKLLKNIFLQSENYDVLQEVILRMKLLKQKNSTEKFRIGEVPITFEKRMYGESKRQLFKFICGYIVTLLRLIRLRICASLKK